MPAPLVQRWRLEIRAAELDRTAKLVGLVLADYATAEGRAWPSRQTIAAAAGVCVRTVEAATVRLELAGLLEVERRSGRGRTNRYQLTVKGAERAQQLRHNGTERAQMTTKKGAAAAPELEGLELEEQRERASALARDARRAFMAGLEAR